MLKLAIGSQQDQLRQEGFLASSHPHLFSNTSHHYPHYLSGPFTSSNLYLDAVNFVGFRDPFRRQLFNVFLDKTPAHILIISENNLSQDELRSWLRFHGPKHSQWTAFAPEMPCAMSLAIFVKLTIGTYISAKPTWFNSRLARLQFRFPEASLAVIGCYYPSGAPKDVEDRDLRVQLTITAKKWIRDLDRSNSSYIFGGDLNGCSLPSLERQLISPLPRVFARHNRTEPEHELIHFLSTHLFDYFRHENPDHPGFTHRQPCPGNGISSARLDYLFASTNLQHTVAGVTITDFPEQIDSAINLTHRIVRMELMGYHFQRLTTPETSRNCNPPTQYRIDRDKLTPAHWEDFRKTLAAAAKHIDTHTHNKDQVNQDLHLALQSANTKLPMRKIQRQRRTKHAQCSVVMAAFLFLRSRHQRSLVAGNMSITDLTDKLMARFPSLLTLWIDHQQRYRNPGLYFRTIKSRLRQLETKRAQATQDCNRLKFQIERDMTFMTNIGRYLPSLIGKTKSQDQIDLAITTDGIVDTPIAVKAAVRENFLHWTPPAIPLNFAMFPEWYTLYHDSDVAISEITAELMRTFSLEEIQFAASRSAGYKAAGASGIQTASIKKGLDIIAPILLHLFNRCLQDGRLPGSWTKSHVFPLVKPGGSKGDLSKLRPIALLESVRKLFFRVIANRILDFVIKHKLLHPWQFGFTPGLQCSYALSTIRSAIDVSSREKLPLFLVSFDIRRAFDSVSLDSLLASLTRFGFPDKFKSIIRFLYDSREAQVHTAFGLTDPFHPENGLDQGDTLSPLLWIIFYDALLCKLNSLGLGIHLDLDKRQTSDPARLPGIKFASLAVADDLTLLARNFQDVKSLIATVDSFLCLHGITCNGDKSIIASNLPTGHPDSPTIVEMRSSPLRPVTDIRGPDQPIKILGTLVRLDGKSTNTIAAMQLRASSLMAAIRHRRISHKIVTYIANSVLLPSLTWKAWCQPFTDVQIEKIAASYRGTLKNKVGLAKSASNHFLESSETYGIRSLQEELDEQNIGLITDLLNFDHPCREVLHQDLLSFRNHLGREGFPLATTHAGGSQATDRLYFVLHRLSTRELTIQPTSTEPHFSKPRNTGPPIEQISAQQTSAADLQSFSKQGNSNTLSLFINDLGEFQAMVSTKKRASGWLAGPAETPKKYRRFAYDTKRIPADQLRIILGIDDHIQPTTPRKPMLATLYHGLPLTPPARRAANHPSHTTTIRRVPLTRTFRHRYALRTRTGRSERESTLPERLAPPPPLTTFLRQAKPTRRTLDLSIELLNTESFKQLLPSTQTQVGTALNATVYTSGTIINLQGGFAISFQFPDFPDWHVISFGYDGPGLSASRVHALAILLTLSVFPDLANLKIVTNSRNCILAMDLYHTLRKNSQSRQRNNHPDAIVWHLIQQKLVQRTGTVSLTLPTKNKRTTGRITAQGRAKMAATNADSTSWNITISHTTEQRFILSILGFPTTLPAKSMLRQQQNIVKQRDLQDALHRRLPRWLQTGTSVPPRLTANHSRRALTGTTSETLFATSSPVSGPLSSNKTAQNLTPRFPRTVDVDDFRNDFNVLFQEIRLERSRIHREQDSLRISQHLKLVSDTLPTSVIMQARKPHLPYDGLCPRCRTNEETRDHLTRCPAITDDTLSAFDNAFKSAVIKITKHPERTRRWFTTLYDSVTHLIHLDWLFLAVLLPPIVTELANTAQISDTMAEHAILSGLHAARGVFLDKIWKPRCKDMILWERSVHIAKKDKRTHPTPLPPIPGQSHTAGQVLRARRTRNSIFRPSGPPRQDSQQVPIHPQTPDGPPLPLQLENSPILSYSPVHQVSPPPSGLPQATGLSHPTPIYTTAHNKRTFSLSPIPLPLPLSRPVTSPTPIPLLKRRRLWHSFPLHRQKDTHQNSPVRLDSPSLNTSCPDADMDSSDSVDDAAHTTHEEEKKRKKNKNKKEKNKKK